MKKTFLICSLLMLTFLSGKSANLTENFNSGVATSTYGSATNVELASGTWTMYGVAANTSSSVTAIKYNTNGGYIITPSVNNPGQINFKYRSGGSNKDVIVAYTTNGTTWQQVDSFRIASSSSSYATYSKSTGLDATANVQFRILAKASNVYVDDVDISMSSMAAEPSTQAGISASGTTGAATTITFAKGNGSGRLLVYQKDSAVTWTPADGTAYTGTFPKSINTNLWAASSDDANSCTVSGLMPGETYYFAVFEYNGDAADRNYKTPAGTCSMQTATEPTLTLSASSMAFQKVLVGNTRTKTFTISGKYLTTTAVTLTSDNNAISLSTDGSTFAQSINLTTTVGTLAQTTISVRFSPTAYQNYTTTLSASCGTANANVIVSGIGSNTENYEYYISPSGNDATGDGSLANPWYNLQKAVNMAAPGNVIICRGGTYSPNMADSSNKTTIRISTSGTATATITIRNYDGELPVFDFAATQLLADKSMVGVRGFEITGDYWHIYGITITHAGDNGIKLEGNHNTIERCTFCYNLDTGIQLGFGHDFSASGFGSKNDGSHCAYNTIIDCDSYRNCDFDSNYGSDADGFACKMHNGLENRFIRCRSWENSDDAWDLYETDYPVYLIECWAWGSGRPEDHLWVKDYLSGSASFSGNGNGIKMGGNGTGGSSTGKHEAWNCVAFNCNKTGSVKGFDQNSHKGGEKLVNCLAFNCGYDFMYEQASANSEYYNNVCIGRQEIAGGTNSHNALGAATTKGWQTNVIVGVSTADYTDLTEATAKGPRAADGSLPANFARLRTGSLQVNAGLPYYIPYATEFPQLQQPIYGSARDLGPYELEEGDIQSGFQQIFTHSATNSMSLMQNPVRTEAVVKFSTTTNGTAQLSVCNLSGQTVSSAYTAAVQSGVDYYVPIDVSQLNAGMYLCLLKVGNHTQTVKMVVVK